MRHHQPRRAVRHSSLALAAMLAFAAPARAAIEESYAPGEPPITTTWFAAHSETAQRADREYVAGMRPHHAGALTMSADYLRDPGRSSPLLQALSRAIVVNQRFEIGVLDEVGRNLAAPPVRLPFGLRLQPVATEGLTGTQRFFKEPIPSAAGHATGPVTEADVRFAKAMIIHHEAAVEMARGYLGDGAARNGFLGLMNVDIITDQTQEIALMRRVIAAYPGNPDAVVVDPSMIHGMEGMAHGGHGAAAGWATAQAAPGTDQGGHAGHGGAGAATPAQAGPGPHAGHGTYAGQGTGSPAVRPRLAGASPGLTTRPAPRRAAGHNHGAHHEGHQHHHH